jgi:hypothetical protein
MGVARPGKRSVPVARADSQRRRVQGETRIRVPAKGQAAWPNTGPTVVRKLSHPTRDGTRLKGKDPIGEWNWDRW